MKLRHYDHDIVPHQERSGWWVCNINSEKPEFVIVDTEIIQKLAR